MDSILFSPIQIANLTLRNRISVPPMCMWKARDGMAQAFHEHHYAAFAASGVGSLTIEATGVTADGRISPWCLGLWKDEQTAGIKRIVDAVKVTDQAVKIIIQLAHAGRKGSCDPAADATIAEGGWQTVAPSPLSRPGYAEPRALAPEEIPVYVEAFAAAARRAVAAGVDAIEIHAAHGYLIHQFLSPLSNKRTDEYGGPLENRMRFALDVIKAVKRAVPADFPVGIRISATDWLPEGWSLEDSIALVKAAKALGVSFVDVSTGGLVPAPIPVRPGYQLPFAAKIREAVPGIAVFGVGLILNAFQAETALVLEACDVIDIGRGILADPNWGWHAARDLHVKDMPCPAEKSFALR